MQLEGFLLMPVLLAEQDNRWHARMQPLSQPNGWWLRSDQPSYSSSRGLVPFLLLLFLLLNFFPYFQIIPKVRFRRYLFVHPDHLPGKFAPCNVVPSRACVFLKPRVRNSEGKRAEQLSLKQYQ